MNLSSTVDVESFEVPPHPAMVASAAGAASSKHANDGGDRAERDATSARAAPPQLLARYETAVMRSPELVAQVRSSVQLCNYYDLCDIY